MRRHLCTLLTAFLLFACSTGTEDPGGRQPVDGKADDPYAEPCEPACGEGTRCFEGRCVLELCDDETPCSEGGACLDGACCYSDEECGFCDDEDCAPPEPACDCDEENERCFEGRCVVELCDDETPCSEGGFCWDGACCYSDEECGFCDDEDC